MRIEHQLFRIPTLKILLPRLNHYGRVRSTRVRRGRSYRADYENYVRRFLDKRAGTLIRCRLIMFNPDTNRFPRGGIVSAGPWLRSCWRRLVWRESRGCRERWRTSSTAMSGARIRN